MSILDDARPGMNPDIRPQDDLFGHVNGVWLDTAKIPDDRSSWGPFVELADTAEQQVKTIIQELADEVSAGRGEVSEDARKIAALYASFMDEDTIAARGLAPAQPLIDEALAVRDTRELAAFIGRFERIGGSGLFGAYVDTDDRDSDRYLFNILQGGLGLPDESYYREDKFAEIREKYVAYLTELLTLGKHADPAAAARTVLALETKLAAGHWERAETRDVLKTYNLTTADELVALAPEFDWHGYATALGGSDATIAETCVRQPSYLTHLSGLLAEVPIEQWRDWLLTRVLRACSPYLTDEFVRNNFEFYGRTLNGTPEMRARWKRAVAFVEGSIGEAVGKQYVARHFPPASKAKMDDLVANLLEAYRQSIARLDWMTDETKERAYEKLATFRPKIGYPDTFRDYSALQVSPDDLLGNAQAAAAFESDRELAKIGSPVDRDEWFMLPQTVNAYYNPGTNEICFPAGILQKPFFSPDADPAENYGGIGAVIGHEIGHGFDDQGAQYDGAGNLNDWWTADDKTAFEAKSKALVKQYDAFSPRNLPGEFVNGSLTVGENIGDLGGLTIGHTAYLISLDGAPMPESDGMTGSQRLFKNWAYCWRTKRRKEQEQQYLTIDPHSPPEFRANIVRNLDEFHEAFGTVEGDGLWLDPSERVRIW
ncbi:MULTISPECIES: M13-type metalloendopeptidase [Streptomyces]|uniref:Peptidase M13 n=1 Tax=Streptomyces venezuelae TaxID=54571 RepID=A0A5P2BKX3_STRVZ|nr:MULTISPECIES: M13-type metalloendopeptidase [Streptomyces]NEA03286.1 peptidase M13 [Streptomyces sp. SID10116]MYY87549.1 peptidase M13 [Streptomyces sp. SID335]MYZ14664.1 peptidase M13 [Streptomyces sp. SID337]NDZ89972.1 peptidase M13 [Streptomyces sp. SID10115]NEB42887.1 peptidase M13 [Streptomyces sp. SID339]